MRVIGIILVILGAVVASYGTWMKVEFRAITLNPEVPRITHSGWHAQTVVLRMIQVEADGVASETGSPGGRGPELVAERVQRVIHIIGISGGVVAGIGVVVALMGWRRKFEDDAMRRVRAMSMSENPQV